MEVIYSKKRVGGIWSHRSVQVQPSYGLARATAFYMGRARCYVPRPTPLRFVGSVYFCDNTCMLLSL